MSSVPSLTNEEKLSLNRIYQAEGNKVFWTGCSVVAATFLLIGALGLITCGCICLTLPGVNALTHVILPAVLPGVFGILLSLPLILEAVKNNREKVLIRDQLIFRLISYLEKYGVPEMETEEMQIDFILDNFCERTWAPEYGKTLIARVKEVIGDKEGRNKTFGPVLDKVQEKVMSGRR